MDSAPAEQKTACQTAESVDKIMWVEKYRPKTLDDVVYHTHVLGSIRALIDKNKFPHLLLSGPSGTGKTSTILAAARYIYGDDFDSMVMECNASDDRSINFIREQVKMFASSSATALCAISSKNKSYKCLKPNNHNIDSTNSGISSSSNSNSNNGNGDAAIVKKKPNFKLIILDEADQITTAAQFALRCIIERYSANTRFCLLVNYLNNIIPAIQSRCVSLTLGQLPSEVMIERLRQIAMAEHLSPEPGALETIAQLSRGDMRKCINLLQSCGAYESSGPSVESVYDVTGLTSPADIDRIMGILFYGTTTRERETAGNEDPAKMATTVSSQLEPTPAATIETKINADDSNNNNGEKKNTETGTETKAAINTSSEAKAAAGIKETTAETTMTVAERLRTFWDLVCTKGLALPDVLDRMSQRLTINMAWVKTGKSFALLLDRLAACEQRLAVGSHDKLQAGAIVGACYDFATSTGATL